MRITLDLLQNAPQYINPAMDREINLRANKIPVIEKLGAMRVFIPASEGPELIAAIWAHADPVRADVVIISQVLCFVLPAEECIRAIADGDLWEWWDTLEEKRCGRFDLLWPAGSRKALVA